MMMMLTMMMDCLTNIIHSAIAANHLSSDFLFLLSYSYKLLTCLGFSFLRFVSTGLLTAASSMRRYQ